MANESKQAPRTISLDSISSAVRQLGLARLPLMIHSSLRSFGRVEGGPQTVLDAFLEQGCTVMVPTFSSVYTIPPEPDQRLERNYPDDRVFDNLSL